MFQRAKNVSGRSNGIFTTQIADVAGNPPALSNLRQVSGKEDVVTYGSWAYDDAQFLGTVEVGMLPPKIFINSALAAGKTAKITDSTMWDLAPDISPDKKYIIFESHIPDAIINKTYTTYPSEIFIIQAPYLPASASCPLPAGQNCPSCVSRTYTPWGMCQMNNKQYRQVLEKSPANCTGEPLIEQSCTFQAVCQYTYTPWQNCNARNLSTRMVLTALPNNCQGTPNVSHIAIIIA